MNGLPIQCTMVSVVAVRGNGSHAQVLLLRRAKPHLHSRWIYIAGHLEAGETAWQCAARELFEEAGLQASELYSANTCETYYDASQECIAVVPAFVARVDSGASVTLDAESDAYRWLSFAQAMPLLPFGSQRELFGHIQREFVDRTPDAALRMPTG